MARAISKVAASITVLFLLFASVGIAAILGGIGDERLRSEAQAALHRLGGDEFLPTIGATSVSLDGFATLGLKAEDVRVGTAHSAELMRIGSLNMGLRVLPLARGDVRVSSVSVADARVDVSALPGAESSRALPIFDDDGLIDPDAAIQLVFKSARQMLEMLDTREVDRIALSEVEIITAETSPLGPVHVREAKIARSGPGQLALTAELELGGRTATIEGTAAIDEADDKLKALSLMIDAPEVPEGTQISGWAAKFASASITLGGSQKLQPESFTLSAQIDDLALPIGREGFVGDFAVDATAAAGAEKLEINRLLIGSGRSTWDFHGAIGPMPRDGAAERGYRFEFVTDGSSVAPEESPEPAIHLVAKISGHTDAGLRTIDISQIAGRSDKGVIAGRSILQFEEGKSPGVQFRIGVQDMPVAYTKQLWPWFAANSARRWVLANVFGGSVEDGQVELNVPPGRLGNGVPLGAGEVFGEFRIRNTRFDVAGHIPPVRDAIGAVKFDGTDVDISLQSGTAYMPTGRTVAGKDGTLTIRNAHVRPVIGKLQIDISGNADAVLEMAGYDPINVGRYIDLKPEELEGQVTGSVTADIPLHRDIPVETLGWKVELDYEDVSLTREFEGQKVTQATGSIAVDPKLAVIKTKAQLNGSPATLDLTEPLGKDKSQRRRLVELQLDDKTRQRLAPGLSEILSGPAGLKFDHAATGEREISVALNRSSLSLPWIGWSKGAGVPATASFKMKSEGKTVSLSDFKLTGDSFGASGSLVLNDGVLQSARFGSARLNRGDDFSVDISAKGKGYAISVRGKSADVRSVVKLYTTMSGSDGGGSSGGTRSINLDVQLDAVTGFHGETLRNVRVVYAGTGSRTDRLEFSAITASGRPVAYVDTLQGGQRRIDMTSTDAGAVLRFLDFYEYMRGGEIALALGSRGDGNLAGHIDARNFWIVDEPRLASIVSSTPPGDSRSLNQAVRREIDTQSVEFERGFSRIVKGPGGISLDSGVLRGPLIGMSFQGTLADAQGNIAMTGTFMPAYGLNRIFGEIPLIGELLGNGRDRGLIGVTFRVLGRKDNPQLEVNPLSVIAPGIFRSVFEFK
ncbi:uncharacterized protein DUF3971 [Aminobacter sp. J15]|nr:uncharacterized protein DUF3971 [Aminobacter sp. J44]TWH23884.1 uncharacterized protein DUF3971 [Aminobacter sp. J15]